MSEHFFTKQIGEYMRDRFKTQLESSLSLKTCHYGDLDPFPTDEILITSIVPAIFIQPMRLTNDFATINQRYNDFITYRVFLVDRLPEGITQEHVRRKIELVADEIVDDLRLDQSTSPNLGSPAKAQIVWSIVKDIDYRPPEENFLAACNAMLFASALTWQVNLRMFK